jgi:hypothetical protein
MSAGLQAEIEGIIQRSVGCDDDLECQGEIVGIEDAALLVIALLKERGDSTWYCERFSSADAYNSDVCARYKHVGCGPRLIVDLGETDV